MWHGPAGDGLERCHAWFAAAGFARHRHDTYAIGVTVSGVQRFWYRGAVHASLPGQVVVLHPDESHDGFAGTAAGFGYRLVYVAPSLVAEVARAIGQPGGGLPFVPAPVADDARLRAAVLSACAGSATDGDPDALRGAIVDGLLRLAGARPSSSRRAGLDERALARARALLSADGDGRAPSAGELEAACGLSRYELARQFRARFGTAPQRFGAMCRLRRARSLIAAGEGLAQVAAACGFADQAHLTRRFREAWGVTPARFAALSAKAPTSSRQVG